MTCHKLISLDKSTLLSWTGATAEQKRKRDITWPDTTKKIIWEEILILLKEKAWDLGRWCWVTDLNNDDDDYNYHNCSAADGCVCLMQSPHYVTLVTRRRMLMMRLMIKVKVTIITIITIITITIDNEWHGLHYEWQAGSGMEEEQDKDRSQVTTDTSHRTRMMMIIIIIIVIALAIKVPSILPILSLDISQVSTCDNHH